MKQNTVIKINLFNNVGLILNLSVLAAWLEDLDHNFNLSKIIIEGEGCNILSHVYLDLLIKLCSTYTGDVTVTTSLKQLNKILINDSVNLQVHLPSEYFDKEDLVVKDNIKALSSNKVLTSFSYIDECINYNPLDVVNKLNNLSLKSWEIKLFPCVKSTPDEIEKVLNVYLSIAKNMNFAFINDYILKHIKKSDNYFNTIYLNITAQGGLSHYMYNEDGGLVEKVYTDIIDLKKDLALEEKVVLDYCEGCPLQLYCNSECINPYWDGLSCSGLKNLLK